MKYLSINSRSRQIASQSCIAAALPDHQRQTYACVRVGGSVWVCAAAWEASDSLIRQIRRIYLEIRKVIAKGRRRTSAVELAAKRPVNWVHCGHKNVIAASATVCVSPSACACVCVRVCGAVHTTWPGKSERVFFRPYCVVIAGKSAFPGNWENQVQLTTQVLLQVPPMSSK